MYIDKDYEKDIKFFNNPYYKKKNYSAKYSLSNTKDDIFRIFIDREWGVSWVGSERIIDKRYPISYK
jgi:hypothetical protein